MSTNPKKAKAPAQPVPREKEEPAKPARRKPAAPTGQETAVPRADSMDIPAMQRALGNAAMMRMMHGKHGVPHPASVYGLKRPFEQVALWLAEQARIDGQTELLKRFAALSTGQKIAFLKLVAEWYTGGNLRALSTEGWMADWERIELYLRRVEPVPLEDQEAEKEGQANRARVKTESDDEDAASPAGLLSPYREIVFWLNYKAYRQGKRDIMREFDNLTQPQKKWAIRYMGKATSKSLRMKTFAETMTIRLDRMEWVDWEAVQTAIAKAKRLSDERLELDEKPDRKPEEAVLSADLPDDGELEEERDGEDSWGWLSALALLAGAAGGEEEKRDRAANPFLEDPRNVQWLLLGVKGSEDAVQAIRSFLASPPNKADIVDRFLGVSPKLPPKEREPARERLLKQFGFRSAEQAFAHLMEKLGELLFEKGVRNEEQEFVRIIEQQLGLTREKGKLPSVRMIAQKLSRT